MSEPTTFSLVRQFAASHGVSFADVERGLYGDVPPLMPARRVAALVKNAVAALEGTARVSPLKRTPSRVLPEGDEPITDEVREQHAYEFAEREGLKIDSGMEPNCGSRVVMPDCCAYHSTLTEVGCVEFYDFMLNRTFVDFLVRCPRSNPLPVICSRCEAVGHEQPACPFAAGDVDMQKVAARRRERRARREVAA